MAETIDWPSLHAEALDILVRYIQIDTSNPPGNEAEGGRLLARSPAPEGTSRRFWGAGSQTNGLRKCRPGPSTSSWMPFCPGSVAMS